MPANALPRLLLGACCLAAGAGCQPKPSVTPVQITFHPQFAGQEATCGGQYPASAGNPAVDYKLVEYRWYASDFHLRDAAGTRTGISLDSRDDGLQYQNETDNVALLGFVAGCDGGDEPATNFEVSGQAPEGRYTKLCFSLGVPFALNHSDVSAPTTPSPLNLPAMYWHWKGGHKFARFDGLADPQGANNRFNLHLGSTGCDSPSVISPPGEACAAPNTPTYCFAIAGTQRLEANINVDPARLLAATDIRRNTPGTAPGCLSFIDDPECASIMPRLGLPYRFNGRSIAADKPVLFQ